MLSIDRLAQRYGTKLRLEIVAQDEEKGTRVSCVRTVPDGFGLACSATQFFPGGAEAFGAHHRTILDGAMIGKTIAASGVAHTRTATHMWKVQTNFALQYLLQSLPEMHARTVTYQIEGMPYCRIQEFYSHWAPGMPAARRRGTVSSMPMPPFTVAPLYGGSCYDEPYQRLTHGFLRSARHVGIDDVDEYVAATRATYGRLREDANTRLFVAAGDVDFIGYAAVNMHPALHVNGAECMLRELYVQESSRRMGVATALVRYVERFAKQQGGVRISFATNWSSEAQRGFYERLGYGRLCDFVAKKI